MILLTGEIALPLHRAVVLAFRLVQDDAHPFTRGKEGGADVGHRPPLTLSCHLDYGADLKGNEMTRSRELSGNHQLTEITQGNTSTHFLR